MAVFFILVSSCSNRPPTLKNPANGIAAIPVDVTNTSGFSFADYFKVIDDKRPEMTIKLYPQGGESFVFSPEVPSGKYNFTILRSILNSQEYEATNSVYDKAIILPVEIKPGSITVTNEKLVINQYSVPSSSGNQAVQCDFKFEQLSDNDLKSIIVNLKGIDGVDKWKIANEL